ncbi:MAG: bifunctional UDP-N-acetylmuramoyl-tripeptide:D-alanyl-D-alanine ligase/alanine racemase [Flavobacteriaceae bacterium]|jgi:alanine racemase|nr:bifunctional UDP-N-acetylmuramoyl-tripeptide:D-alanyl-D-alanine ligase/alanine racemase [Flavobacteriaceae bacterium]
MKFNTDVFCAFLEAELISGACSTEIEIDRISIDSRSLQNDSKSMFFALSGKNHDGHQYINELIQQGVKYFVVNKEVQLDTSAPVVVFKVVDTLDALQKLAQMHRTNFHLPVIGITGSKGKTIVKEWLNYLLSDQYSIIKNPKSYNSQTGVPLSVFGIAEKHNLGIFEAGISTTNEMNKLQKIVQPTIGVLTTITEEHAEGFESIEQKIAEKVKLFEGVNVVITPYDRRVMNYLKGKEIITWSFQDTEANLLACVDKGKLHLKYNKTLSFEIVLPFVDEVSTQNMISCIAVLLYLGYPIEVIQKRVAELYPVEMRLQVKNGINNCSVIDDAYNADFQSLVIALDFLEKHKLSTAKTVILSDLFANGFEEADLYLQVKELLSSYQVTRLICIGERISDYMVGFKNAWLFSSTEEFLQKVSISDFSDETILVKGARGFRFDKIITLLEEKTHETVLEVNLTAIRHNLNFYRSRLKPETKVMVMVKAFGYGNGSFEIAKLLAHEKVSYLGVAFADEGIALRKSGVTTPIIVMNPEIGAFSAMIAYDLEPEVYSVRELSAFLKVARERNCYQYPIHIKLDTGMHRHGFLTGDLDELIQVLKETNVVEVKSIFSHLSSSDMPEYKDFTLGQIELFLSNSNKLIEELAINPIRHILNTSGIYHFPEYQLEMVRLGIGLYGVGNDEVEMSMLQNVSTLRTQIMQIKEIEDQESVGYGRRFRSVGKTKVATVPIGYADGVHRSWGNSVGYVLVNNAKAPIIGSICMDMLMIDVTEVNCKENDEVIIFGKALPVTEIASKIATIPYEILTSISQRVKRNFYEE